MTPAVDFTPDRYRGRQESFRAGPRTVGFLAQRPPASAPRASAGGWNMGPRCVSSMQRDLPVRPTRADRPEPIPRNRVLYGPPRLAVWVPLLARFDYLEHRRAVHPRRAPCSALQHSGAVGPRALPSRTSGILDGVPRPEEDSRFRPASRSRPAATTLLHCRRLGTDRRSAASGPPGLEAEVDAGAAGRAQVAAGA
jgi:hypothetical protein